MLYYDKIMLMLQGSDPLISTARGKLQSRRSKLNDQINRELRMRNGAENLFRYFKSAVSYWYYKISFFLYESSLLIRLG
jgi:hypothetical protein